MTFFKPLFFSAILLFLSYSLIGQQEVELLPDGLILPRFTNTEINSLPGVLGQCVYSSTQKSIFCHDGVSYKNIHKTNIVDVNLVEDDDKDTSIDVEASTDIDEIEVTVSGTTGIIIDKLPGSDLRINMPTPRDNVIIGENAGDLLGNFASDNVIIGANAGVNSIDGKDNIFLGQNSGNANSDGDDNVYIGNNSGLSDSQGDRNVFVGSESGKNFNSTSGSAVGNNTFIGYESGGLLTGGTNNTYVGSRSGLRNNGTQNIFIGNGAGANETNVDQTLIIDNNSVDEPLIYGEFDNEIVRIGGDLEVLPKGGLPNNTHLRMLDSQGNMDEIIRRSGIDNSVVIGDVNNNGGSLFLRAAGFTRLSIVPEGAIKFPRFNSPPLTCDNSNTQNRGLVYYDDSDDEMKYCGRNFIGDFEWIDMN